MRVTRKTFTGEWVTSEMSKDEYIAFRKHRVVTMILSLLIGVLAIVCGIIWLEVLLRL